MVLPAHPWVWGAIYVVLAFGAAFNAKALGVCIVVAVGVSVVYPDLAAAGGLLGGWMLAYLVSGFRD